MTTATVSQVSNFHRGQRLCAISVAATLVNTTLDVPINVSGLDRIFVQITVATAALTGFAIKAKSNTDAAASTLYSTAGDFTTPVGLLVGASGDLTIQGVGVGWFIMDVSGLESIILTATSGGTATLAVEAGGA